MPFIIYIFSLCAFAIGFTEFISIGLAPTLANSLHASTAQIGLTVTFYALGVAIGAPILTTLAARWPRKYLLTTAMLVFALSNVAAALAAHLTVLLVARTMSGLSHGVFFAVASSVAARLVPRQQAGHAIAWVFGGVTIAMTLGIPVGAYLGHILPWRWIFILIATCGGLGALGITRFLTDIPRQVTRPTLVLLLKKPLMMGAGLPFFAYVGSFTLYTFATPLMTQQGASVAQISIALLAYGIGAAIGNIAGGKLTDRQGIDYAATLMLTGIALSLTLITLWGITSIPLMQLLLLALGLTTYGAIPPLQARIMALAEHHCPQAIDSASGLNIAAFNAGVVVGSSTGALVLNHWGFSHLGTVGALAVLLGLALLRMQRGSVRKTP